MKSYKITVSSLTTLGPMLDSRDKSTCLILLCLLRLQFVLSLLKKSLSYRFKLDMKCKKRETDGKQHLSHRPVHKCRMYAPFIFTVRKLSNRLWIATFNRKVQSCHLMQKDRHKVNVQYIYTQSCFHISVGTSNWHKAFSSHLPLPSKMNA